MACAAGRAARSVNFGREKEASSWDSNAFVWHSCSSAVAAPSWCIPDLNGAGYPSSVCLTGLHFC